MTVGVSLKRVVQVGTGSTATFYFNAPVQDDDNLAVYTYNTSTAVQTLQTKNGAGTYDYTVTINPSTKYATITLNNNLPTTHRITILRNIPLTQEVDYVQGDPFSAETHESALDKLTLISAQVQEQQDRSIKVIESSATTNLVMAELVADKLLVVNNTATGIDMGPTFAEVDTVGENIAYVVTVGQNINDVITVANNLDGADTIGTVATNITNVNHVGSGITNVNAVGADLTGSDTIGTVATNLLGTNTVGTVAGNIANVNTVAGISSDVTTVAADGTDIGTVAGISANVTTVAGISANVTTVAGISADVTTVAADGTDIGTVATNIANVNTVAGISGNVTTVAGISADVTTVAADGSDIGTVATNIADVATVAGISGNVTTVAGISANVTTVAGISADVTTAANNVTDITNFADVWYGPSASDPATRVDSSASQTGDLYFNTSTNDVKVYDGSAWQAAYASLSGAILDSDFTVNGLMSRTGAGVYTVITDNSGNWNTAYGWGDHSTQGYATTAATVAKTATTGSGALPSGTTAQRDGSPSAGYIRFNSDLTSFEGYNGSAWGSIGGGASGGGSDGVFYENDQTVTTNYTLTSNKNAMSTGPITINSGVTVTIPTGSRWVVI